MPQSDYPARTRDPDSPARRERRRRTHHRIDSDGNPTPPRSRRPDDRERRSSLPPSPSKHRPKGRPQERSRRSSHGGVDESISGGSTALSADQLAKLDNLNRKLGWSEYDGLRRQQLPVDDEETRAEYDDDREREREERQRRREDERERRRDEEYERRREEYREKKRRRREEERAVEAAASAAMTADEVAYENSRYKRYRRDDRRDDRRDKRRSERRVPSGQTLERGSEYYSEKSTWRDDLRKRIGGSSSSEPSYDEEARRRKRRRNICIAVAVTILALLIIIPVGVTITKRKGSSSSGGDPSGVAAPSNSNLNGISQSSIPPSAQGTYLDPFDWYDTTDFNVTYTDAKVGGLYIMGLNSTWDDSKRANANVPPLNEKWQYGTMKIRGMNLGGWLSIEPFITPSLFSDFSTSDGVVDEWTLSEKLGPTNTRTRLEQHYSSFVSQSTFALIAAAGFDHVRIPFSYWAVTTYDGDPYLKMVSWRYLLRAIEWARKYGLRINLDLHGAPGSQNGWNHSGRQGTIGWLNGTDGSLNGQRTLEIHKQLSTFFTQPRYKNIITMYGLVNEPKMISLDTAAVMTWSQSAISEIRANGFTGLIVIGDGFMGLENWQGNALSTMENIVLDAHQYVVFNTQQIIYDHHDKINFACKGWTVQAKGSMNTNTGFGPTIFGEWSQADTDCAENLNNVGIGSRWEGTLNMVGTPGGSTSGSVLTPTCPTNNNPRCNCDDANADTSSYSDAYKQWLLMFAQAQMDSFEYGWGWFYWTWKTESAPQWSYQDALAAGIVPSLAYQRDWDCTQSIPAFSSNDLPEYY